MESVLSDTSYQNYDVYGDNLRIEAVRSSPFDFTLIFHLKPLELPRTPY
jgi:negative regulator of sigma E activity